MAGQALASLPRGSVIVRQKVAKLASRGKGKKVRFSSGTTFPTVVGVALRRHDRPDHVCQGQRARRRNRPAAARRRVVDRLRHPRLRHVPAPHRRHLGRTRHWTHRPATRPPCRPGSDGDGIIHYHPQTAATPVARPSLGVFLDIYDIDLSTDKLTVPAALVGEGEANSWDIDDGDVFKGTSCEGDDAVITLRVWHDYTSGAFEDKVTDFGNQRFTRNGMVFVIAVVPESDDPNIPKPAHSCQLEDLGVIGSGECLPHRRHQHHGGTRRYD